MGNIQICKRRFNKCFTSTETEIKDARSQQYQGLARDMPKNFFLHKLKIEVLNHLNYKKKNMHLTYKDDIIETGKNLLRVYRIEKRKTVKGLDLNIKGALNANTRLNRILKTRSLNVQTLKFNTHKSSFTLHREQGIMIYRPLEYRNFCS